MYCSLHKWTSAWQLADVGDYHVGVQRCTVVFLLGIDVIHIRLVLSSDSFDHLPNDI